MAGKHNYIVETLDEINYSAEELTTYLNEMSALQSLRLVSVYNAASGLLTIVWELE